MVVYVDQLLCKYNAKLHMHFACQLNVCVDVLRRQKTRVRILYIILKAQEIKQLAKTSFSTLLGVVSESKGV
jgi:hypothetical protein